MTHETTPHRRVRHAAGAALAALALTVLAPAPILRATEGLSRTQTVARARAADAIVAGTVRAIHSRWAGKKIVSVAELAVGSTVKGAAGPAASLRVSFPGGRVEKPVPMAMIVADAPALEESEEVLLFLDDAGDGTFGLTAKFAISSDPTSGRKTVAIAGRSVPLESLSKKSPALNRPDGEIRRRRR